MPLSYRQIALSDKGFAKTLRTLYRGMRNFSMPAPRVIVRPLLWLYLAVRSVYFFCMRVFVCEPLFKAYCKQYGRRVRTGVFVHWIQGKGDIILGDDVLFDGKCSIAFACRFSEHPTLTVGDHTGIGHGCTFTIGKSIRIGRYCRIAGNVFLFDSKGHTNDPVGRMQGLPPEPEEILPITIEDNVWIGRGAVICPGVTVGEGSVISTQSVVMTDVPAYTIVAGNPARKIGVLPHPESATPAAEVPATVPSGH
ncbi:MAG TPA: acyltransferase [Chthonomonadaceae bacterium]|nr:acyltransferase [Chthonomonadaceae bacterium]